MPAIFKKRPGSQCGWSVLRKGGVVEDKIREIVEGQLVNIESCRPLKGLWLFLVAVGTLKDSEQRSDMI